MILGARKASGCLAGVVLWSLMVVTPTAQAPGAGIERTGHDFSLRSGNSQPVGVCTFCHTPHRALQTRLLWNHTLSANTFTWDVATTTGGTNFPTITSTWQGSSKYCLSCHDGSVAIGDVAWFRQASRTGAAAINATKHDSGPFQIASVTGSMAGNHPVAHPFPFSGVASTYNGTTTGAAAVLSGWQPDPTASGVRLFVETGGNVAAGTAVGRTGIECSSCHDPHNGTAVVDSYFLRGKISGGSADGYLCLKCHRK